MKRLVFPLLILACCFSLGGCGHNHEFSEWVVTKEVSCTTDGERTRTCACGETETEVIPSVGHTYGEPTVIREVSCEENGEEMRTCTVCGNVATEIIPATGHKYAAATKFAPKTCVRCGATDGEALAKIVAVGDSVECKSHCFTVESIGFTASLREKRGYVTYSHNSQYALAIKLDFTNMDKEALEQWHSPRISDMTMEYKGKYHYEGEYWIPFGDIVPLGDDSVYIVYEVPSSMGDDVTGEILASFTIDGESYAIVVQKGIKEESVEQPTEALDASGDLAIGTEVTNNSTFRLTLNELYYTAKPSYKTGNVTHSYGIGDYHLVCKLDYTNLDTQALRTWDTSRIKDLKLTFAGEYTYDGVLWIPESEIVPLASGYAFLIFEVPRNIEDSTDPLMLTFSVDGSVFTVNCR